MLLIFSAPVLIRHLWLLKTVVFMHWCLTGAVQGFSNQAKVTLGAKGYASQHYLFM